MTQQHQTNNSDDDAENRRRQALCPYQLGRTGFTPSRTGSTGSVWTALTPVWVGWKTVVERVVEPVLPPILQGWSNRFNYPFDQGLGRWDHLEHRNVEPARPGMIEPVRPGDRTSSTTPVERVVELVLSLGREPVWPVARTNFIPPVERVVELVPSVGRTGSTILGRTCSTGWW